MRYAAAVDANQAEIVRALRDLGCSVSCLHGAGKGVPDLLVGFMGINFLIEVKDGKKPPSQQKLTKDQEKWHAEWNGTVFVINNTQDAIDLILR